MKFNTKRDDVETSEMKQEQSFGIADMGLVFEILRNKLYSNKPLAICREILCNARDAHREIGTPKKPIEIYMPHHIDPQLRIKDYGTGISPDRMENIFLKYGGSTKRETDEQTGGFGLGAKTPFAYTDSFGILTITEGVKRTYLAYIDETRIGKIALTNEEKTNEPNGTEIIIPVQKNDFGLFINHIASVVQFWSVKPQVFNCDNFETKMSKIEIELCGNGWKSWKQMGYYNRHYYKPYLLIDEIKYEIPREFWNRGNPQLSNSPLVFEFQTGEISLSASREAVEFDEKTAKKIEERFENYKATLNKCLQEKINKTKDYLEAIKIYHHSRKENAIDVGEILWDGSKLPTEKLFSRSGFSVWGINHNNQVSNYYEYFSSIVLKNKKLILAEPKDVCEKSYGYDGYESSCLRRKVSSFLKENKDYALIVYPSLEHFKKEFRTDLFETFVVADLDLQSYRTKHPKFVAPPKFLLYKFEMDKSGNYRFMRKGKKHISFEQKNRTGKDCDVVFLPLGDTEKNTIEALIELRRPKTTKTPHKHPLAIDGKIISLNFLKELHNATDGKIIFYGYIPTINNEKKMKNFLEKVSKEKTIDFVKILRKHFEGVKMEIKSTWVSAYEISGFRTHEYYFAPLKGFPEDFNELVEELRKLDKTRKLSNSSVKLISSLTGLSFDERKELNEKLKSIFKKYAPVFRNSITNNGDIQKIVKAIDFYETNNPESKKENENGKSRRKTKPRKQRK